LVYIEDDIHGEQEGPFSTFADALAELRRRAAMAWDSPPNKSPCASWESCGREYCILQYDERAQPPRLLRKAHVLDVSAKGVVWIEGFEQEWARGAE
jgi:hypothetical protein